MPRAKKPKPNRMFPGLPGYTGPIYGMFAFVHHEILFEPSNNIAERVAHIKKYKPKNEQTIRLAHLLWLPPRLFTKDFNTARAALNTARDAYNTAAAALNTARAVLNTARAALDQPAIIDYAKKHIHDFRWDGKTLVFQNERIEQ